MEKLKEEFKYEKRGITLIALVVTIVVLLILAGVAISMLTGENGIITQALQAKEQNEIAEEKEKLELAVQAARSKTNWGKITEENLDNAIKQQFEENMNIILKNNDDGSFLINIKGDTNRIYYIDSSGKVISEENMLKITTAEELKMFRDEVNLGNTFDNKYVYLTNNISLDSNSDWEPIGIYPNDSTGPTSENNIPFKGIFDGCGYTIDGINISSTEKVKGFFAFIEDATIKRLNIGANCKISGGVGTAGVVGYAYNKSNVNNCSNYSNISGNTQSVGGIVGILVNSYINNCYNTGNITGNINVGGIAGYVTNNSKIFQSYNEGTINGKEYYVGGIAGYNYNNSSIENCYNIGDVVADKILGGISGYIRENANINNCYNVGVVKGSSNVGGIVGHINIGTINNCYYLENTVNDSNDIINRDGVNALTEDDLKSITTKLGSSFVPDLENKNNGFPILNWQ